MDDKLYNSILKHVDFEYIKEIINKNKGKKVYCFGGGSTTELLMEQIPELTVECFLDNNSELEGTYLFGVKIERPEIIKKEKKGSYVVLIVSQHVVNIGKQLDDFGLEKDIDYYDIHTPMRPYFVSMKIQKRTNRYMEFIRKIPEDMFENIPITKEEKIGVVCICEASKTLIYYAITKALLLRMDGYRVTLIIDAMSGFESYVFFPKVEKVLLESISPLLEEIKKKCADIEIQNIEINGRADLNENDIDAIKYYVPYVVKWLEGRPEQGISNIAGDCKQVVEDILRNAFSYVKAFFSNHEFSSIDVRTGIHRHRMAYAYIAKQNGMRVSTSDGISLYSSDGPAAHYGDVVKLVKSEIFTTKERNAIIEMAKEDLRRRQYSTRSDKGYNHQMHGYDSHIKNYDVIMPLNIFWDAAALGRDDLFSNEVEWLNQTLCFLMEHTDATVMVREHPAQASAGRYEYEFVDLKKCISCLERYKSRIFFASASDKVNTYQYLEGCKIVLPYTSTVGMEAVMLGKNVITHSKVYYSDCDIGYKAKDKDDYYQAISHYLCHTEVESQKVNSACLSYYFFQMIVLFESKFSPQKEEWLDCTIEELFEQSSIRDILDLVGKGNPIAYSAIRRKLAKLMD